MQIQKSTFKAIKSEFKEREGLVLFGTGGELMDWVNGVTGILFKEKIAKSEDPDAVWDGVYQMDTTGGRTDLLLLFKEDTDLDIGKMAMWRLRFGDASWLSDYFVNFARDHK